MVHETERQVAELADYIVDHQGPFAVRHTVALAKEAHRHQDYAGEAF